MTPDVIVHYKGLEVHLNTIPGTGNTAQSSMEEAVLNKLVDLNDIEVPQEKVDNEVEGRVLELYQKLRYDSLVTGNPHFFIHQEVEDQMEQIKKDAFRQVKTELLLQQIALQEHLQVSRDELEAEAHNMAQRQKIPTARIFDLFGKDLNLLKGDLLIRKTIDLICDSAVFLYV